MLSYSKGNLETLTFATCVIGGAYWTSKYYDLKKADSYKVTSINAVLGVFYAYAAMNVNNVLMYSELVPANILYKGYLTVFGAIVIDIAQDLYYIANPKQVPPKEK